MLHLPDEFLLRLLAEVAVDGGLDFEELLDDVLEVVCFVSCIQTLQYDYGYSLSTVLNLTGAIVMSIEKVER